MAYTRRQEITCTLEELAANSSKVLLNGEILYVKQADGSYAVKIGDGVTTVDMLPYSINYAEMLLKAEQVEESTEKAEKSANSARVSAENAGNTVIAVSSAAKGVSNNLDLTVEAKLAAQKAQIEAEESALKATSAAGLKDFGLVVDAIDGHVTLTYTKEDTE